MSGNTLARVKRLGERVEEESRQAALTQHNGYGGASARSRRLSAAGGGGAGGGAGGGYLSSQETGARSSRRRSSVSSLPRPTHQKRSISAQPLHHKREEADDVETRDGDGVLRHLRSQFQSYSKLGDRRSDGSHISCSQSDKWLKQARIIDGRMLTTVDTAILWKKLCKGKFQS